MTQNTIPLRPGGRLTDEEERIMRETMNHDPSHDEVYEGIPNPIIVFRVELDHAQMAALAAEVTALDIDKPGRATRTA